MNSAGGRTLPEGRWTKIGALAGCAGALAAFLSIQDIRERFFGRVEPRTATEQPVRGNQTPSTAPQRLGERWKQPKVASVPQQSVMEYEELRSRFDVLEQSLRERFRDLAGTEPKPEILSALKSCRQDLDAAKMAIQAGDVNVLRIRLDRARQRVSELNSFSLNMIDPHD